MRPQKAAAIAAAAVSAAAIERRVFAAPRYRGPRSDHFDGERFFNEHAGHQAGLAFLKWRMARQPGWWPPYRELPPGPPPPERVAGGAPRPTLPDHPTTPIPMGR